MPICLRAGNLMHARCKVAAPLCCCCRAHAAATACSALLVPLAAYNEHSVAINALFVRMVGDGVEAAEAIKHAQQLEKAINRVRAAVIRLAHAAVKRAASAGTKTHCRLQELLVLRTASTAAEAVATAAAAAAVGRLERSCAFGFRTQHRAYT